MSAAAIAAVALLGAGCGSSTHPASSTATASSASTATGSPGSTEGSTSAGTSVSNGSGSLAASAATAIAKAMAPPSALTETTPLPSRPPKDKTIIFVNCEVPTCSLDAQGVHEAATALGWKYKQLQDSNANPASLVSALQEALQYHPVAVSFVGIPEALWSSVIPAYQKAKVALLPEFDGPVTITSTVPTSIAQPSLPPAGTDLANWVIADSKGTAHVLLFDVPSYPILESLRTPFQNRLAACTGCTLAHVNATIPEVDGGQVTALIIAALKRNPSTDYLVLTYGPFADGLPAAMKTAGIKGVQIVSGSADILGQQSILEGTESATTTQGYVYAGWLTVDAAARYVEGVQLGSAYGQVPFMLLTKANLTKPATSWDLPANYQMLFKQLWKVG
jgi:ribose transport system substrate-binding protein